MKTILLTMFLFISITAHATNYYVKITGSDNNTGLSDGQAWQTITKVNTVWAAGKFAPGDKIYFNRGDTFIGTLTITESGTEGNLITVDSYGSGDPPIITGFYDISGSWSNVSGNIYRKAVTTTSDIRYLNIGGVNYLMGRFPNTGRYRATHGGEKTFLEDATNLTQSDDYWNGGEVVFRPNYWAAETKKIIDFTQSLHRITFSTSSTYNTSTDFGYFIQNNIHCLKDNGDWCWDGSYVYLYYTSDPSSLTIKVSTYDYGIVINNYDYINLANLNITGYNIAGLKCIDGDHNSFQTNTISRCVNGIYCHNGDYLTLSGNTITYCGYDGILFRESNNGTITGNIISFIGVDGGPSTVVVDGSMNFGYRGLNGVETEYSYGTTISKNDIYHVGYDGIRLSCVDDCIVEKNRVRDYCYLLDDGGGIYFSGCNAAYLAANYPEAGTYSGSTIRFNYIVGSDGIVCTADKYSSSDNMFYTGGIYLDDEVALINVNNNLCVKNWINLQGNSTANCYWNSNWTTKALGAPTHPSFGGAEIQLKNTSPSPSNNVITNNKLFSNYYWNSTAVADYNIWLINVTYSNIFDYNYYFLPTGTYGSTGHIVAGDLNGDVTDFKTAGGINHGGTNDAGDVKVWSTSYTHTTRDQFVVYDYNFSEASRNFAFEPGWTYYDATKGNRLSGVYALNPYEGAILYRINNLDDPDPFNDSTIVPSTLITSISIYSTIGSAITTIGGSLQLNAGILPTNASNKTVTWSITNGSYLASISAATGLVTAIDNGVVTVRATANDGSGIYGTLAITISNQVVPVTAITVTGEGGVKAITKNKGTLQLSATVFPPNATNKSVKWSISSGTNKASSSGTDNASISPTGLLTAIDNGTTTVMATANDGSGIYDTLTISISNQVIPVTSIAITGAGGAKTIATDGGTLQLSAVILPTNATDKTVMWSVLSGIEKATISSIGLATALDNGTAIMRASANDGSGVYGTLSITISNQVNENNLNLPPVIVVDYNSSSYSGFVSEINASNSYDLNKDNLSYAWIAPPNVPVSSTNGSTIKYLNPVVSSTQTVDFILSISDGKTTQSKIIAVEILPYKPGLEVAEVTNLEASSFQTPYYPYNIIDGNIGTMWAASGDNQWLILELKHPFEIQHVKLAFQPGQKRESYFDIFGSEDKVNWESVFVKSASCSFSSNLQVFEFPLSKTGKEFNYVKLVGHGNSVDTWNFFSELKIFGYRHRNSSLYEALPVKIYPNPARETVTIRIDETGMKSDFLQLLDMSGEVILRNEFNPGLREFSIPLNLKNGVYIIQLGTGKLTQFTQKLIVSP